MFCFWSCELKCMLITYNESGIYILFLYFKRTRISSFFLITYFPVGGDLTFVQLITVVHTCTPSICTRVLFVQTKLRSQTQSLNLKSHLVLITTSEAKKQLHITKEETEAYQTSVYCHITIYMCNCLITHGWTQKDSPRELSLPAA